MNEVVKMEPPLVPASLTPMDMIDRAISSGASMEALEKLMALQERWEANQGRKAFDKAIAEAKAEIPPIFKNRQVDFTSAKGRTNYRHEDLAQIAATVDPILSAYGLSYRFRTAQDGQIVTVTCILSHRDGYSEETTLSSAADQSGNKNHIQAVGSAATYLQRYTLKMALGLAASNDDDGKSSSQQVQHINVDQFVELTGMIEKTGSNPVKLAQWLGVEMLEEITVQQWNNAMSQLKKKAGANGTAQ